MTIFSTNQALRRPPDELRMLADSQDGVFTTAQARAVGLSALQLAQLCRGASLTSLGRSLFALSSALPARPEDRYAMKVRAALLLYPESRPCGASALALAGLPLWGLPLNRVELVRPGTHEVLTQVCRLRPANAVIRPLASDEVDVGAEVVQLALDHGIMSGVVAADAAMNREMTTSQAILEAVDGVRGWPAASAAAAMARFMDGRAQSVLESRTRVCLAFGEVPTDAQVPVEEEGHIFAWLDLVVRGTRTALECDGKVKYATGDPDVLWREKRREDRIRRRGYAVERVVHADLEAPGLFVQRIRRLAGLPPGRTVDFAGEMFSREGRRSPMTR